MNQYGARVAMSDLRLCGIYRSKEAAAAEQYSDKTRALKEWHGAAGIGSREKDTGVPGVLSRT